MNQSNAFCYQSDRFLEGFEQLTFHFPKDDEGEVIATLVRKKCHHKTAKAVLYIHGFIDYFFQTEMAEQFNQHGYDFYALDLRKYGRSLLPHQTAYAVRDLKEYHAEIHRALDIITLEQHDHIVMSGHSTGGLIVTQFMKLNPHFKAIKAIWLNSPFFDFNANRIEKKIGIPLLSQLALKLPHLKFPSGLNPNYVPSLHRDFHGEWLFDLKLKPKTYPKVEISFIRAIHIAQQSLKAVHLSQPTLMMHSDRSTQPKKFNADATNSDIILNIKDMQRLIKSFQSHVDVMTIKGALHDVVLSQPKVRHQVYQKLFQWLALHIK